MPKLWKTALGGTFAVLILVGLGACGTARDRSGTAAAHRNAVERDHLRPPARKTAYRGFRQVGWASWYGRKFHGRKTASGERFDMNAMTAAHRTLPFGARVRVTNLHNGRSAVVRINDRGPFVKGRIIDLSRRAANALGYVGKGKARVRVESVGG